MTKGILLTAAAVSIFAILGCGGAGRRDTRFFYRLTNAVTDVSGVDFRVDKNVTNSNVQFGDSTTFVEVNDTEPLIFFDILEAGTNNDIDSIVVEKQSLQSVHLFGLGVFNPGSLQPQARLVPVIVNRDQPQGNNARIVLVHGYVRAAGTQTPNIDFVRSGRISPVVEDLAFGASSTFNLAAGTYDFEVRIADLMTGVLFTRTGVTIQAGKIYVFLLQGLEGAGGNLTPAINIFEEPVRIP